MIENDVYSVENMQGEFDIVRYFGLLYHLSDPTKALRILSEKCTEIFLLETCVSFGNEPKLNLVTEPLDNVSLAVDGVGCRQTRVWVFNELQKLFDFVYVSRTQPKYPKFPLNWQTTESEDTMLSRSVYVASRRPIESDNLLGYIPAIQTY